MIGFNPILWSFIAHTDDNTILIRRECLSLVDCADLYACSVVILILLYQCLLLLFQNKAPDGSYRYQPKEATV